MRLQVDKCLQIALRVAALPECLLNPRMRGQTLEPVVDVLGAGRVGICPFQGEAATLLSTTQDPAYCR